jgi:hypothetical protein
VRLVGATVVCPALALILSLAVVALLPWPASADPVDEIRFTLPSVRAEPGEIVDVPLGVAANGSLAMVSWSIEYDAEALTFVQICVHPNILKMLDDRPEGETLLDWYTNPEEGWLQVSLVTDFLGRESLSIPPGLLASLAILKFWVPPDAPRGSHRLSFPRPGTAGFPGNFRNQKGPVYNAARGHGRPFSENDRFEGSSTPEVEDGAILVSIIGDVGIFRGDANLDYVVDVSDPTRILDCLFMNGAPMECQEAADANADGSVDISDPVAILNYLFISATDWSPSEIRPASQACR